MTLVSTQTPAAACLLLRMMRPNQSAAALDAMTPERRRQVLSHVETLQRLPFAELQALEKQIRACAYLVPDRALGSEKETIDFWGNVISESTSQDSILEEIEEKAPELGTQLTKFKFKLEQAASLPDSLLQKVLSKVDNEELCLALGTCAQEIREVFLEALTPARRQALVNLFPSYRGAPREKAIPARQKLTKRIREALA